MNGYLILILSQVMLGSIAVFARWVQLPAEAIVFFRCLFAAMTIGSVIYFRESLRPYLRLNRTLFLLVLTGIFMASNWYFFFKAVLSTEIATTMLLYNFAPIFVLLSAVLFLREVPTLRQAACLVVSVFGLVMILGHGKMGLGSFEPGALYALLAGALYSQVTIIGRYLKSVPATVITLFQTGVGAILFLPAGISRIQTIHVEPRQWAILIAIGLFHTAVPYLMYFRALKKVKATIAGILQYIYTLSSIAFGVIFFHEAVALNTWIGGAMILVSSFIALKYPGQKPFNFRRIYAQA
jgi:RarD protein